MLLLGGGVRGWWQRRSVQLLATAGVRAATGCVGCPVVVPAPASRSSRDAAGAVKAPFLFKFFLH